jgi:HlyD family secretion protein
MSMDKAIEKNKWPLSRIAKFGGMGAVVLLLVYFVLSVGDGKSKNVQTKKMRTSVVKYDEFQEFISITGTVQPKQTIYLDAVEGGMVEKLYVEAGTVLMQGDPIIKLSNTNMLLDIMYREAELVQQSNNLRNSRLSYEQNRLSLLSQLAEINYQLRIKELAFDRKKQLYEKDFVSKEEYELAKNAFDYYKEKSKITLESHRTDSVFRLLQIDQLEISLDRMNGNMKIVKEKLDRLTVKAPIGGLLSSLNAEVGQHKSPGQRLGQIDQDEGLKIVADVDEHFIARVSNGQTAKVELGGDDYSLKIIKVYPEVQNGRFNIDLEFVGDIPANITRGQTLHLKLELGETSQALLLERGGFFRKTGGRWIYVVDEDGETAIRRDIKIGRMNPYFYEVIQGLEEGDKVITSAYDSFGDSDQLNLK